MNLKFDVDQRLLVGIMKMGCSIIIRFFFINGFPIFLVLQLTSSF